MLREEEEVQNGEGWKKKEPTEPGRWVLGAQHKKNLGAYEIRAKRLWKKRKRPFEKS